MPPVDAVQLVRAAINKNREIPAILDAYGEFLDSPIGALELNNLGEIFARILDNLTQRFPDTASKRAAKTVQADVMTFLETTANDPDRLKEVMRKELVSVVETMASSISERFRRMSYEERQAIDSTLRILRRSKLEPIFKAEVGKHLASDPEFERYFLLVRSQAPEMRELRYENLIVEKGIYNKLVVKSTGVDYVVWVPSFYAKHAVDLLIEKDGVTSDRSVLSRMKDLEARGELSEIEPFLIDLDRNLGLSTKEIPPQVSDLFKKVGQHNILAPIDMDDVTSYFDERRDTEEMAHRQEAERARISAEAEDRERERQFQLQRQKMTPKESSVANDTKPPLEDANSIYLGKTLDFEDLVRAIDRKIPEKEVLSQVKQLGEYYLLSKGADLSIAGASGSGKSVTLSRVLDGIAAKKERPNVIVIDQKGEHRGIAWKYNWPVIALAADSQAVELRIELFTGVDEENRLAAELLQEWFTQNGLSCSDIQKERIASIFAARDKVLNIAGVADLLLNEAELAQLGQRLKKNLTQKGVLVKVFSDKTTYGKLLSQSIIFDISGRGLKDPSTKEERVVLCILLLRDIISTGVRDSVIVIEDVLDRIKVESLKERVIGMVKKMRERGNTLIITSRGGCRRYLADKHIELIHRLSGEKTIREELSEFDTDVHSTTLARTVGFLPRGCLFTSRIGQAAAVRVERLEFVVHS